MEPEGRLGEASFADGATIAIVEGRKNLGGSPPTPNHLLLHILELRLPAKLQICFCFPAEERMLQKDLEEDPFAVEVPFVKGDDVD